MTVTHVFGLNSVRLFSADPLTARSFYETIGGASPVAGFDSIASWSAEVPDSVEPSGWIVEFGTPDASTIIDRCTALGARIEGRYDRSTIISDPAGVRFSIRKAKTPSSEKPLLTGNAILADLYTRTTAESTAFYCNAFSLDLRVLPDDPVDYLQLLANDKHVLGVLDVTTFLGARSPDQWMPYLYFPNVDGVIERATALGALVVAPASDSPTGKYAILRDPFGNLIGVWDGASLTTPAEHQTA